jgi:AmmeMemoRadiSam system protein A
MICEVALGAICQVLTGSPFAPPDPARLPDELAAPGASFVTLELGDCLLGCVGSLSAVRPLGVDVARHAVAAAFDDPRLPPITVSDYENMATKVSVLSPLRPLATDALSDAAARLRPGVDGVVVEHGSRRATFLPSVWAKVPDVTTFLDALWGKAGIPPRTWTPDLRISTYTTTEYTDPGPRPYP